MPERLGISDTDVSGEPAAEEEVPFNGEVQFGRTIQMNICSSGDPSVYNNVCLCSFYINDDGTRQRAGPKCTRCRNVITIELPALGPSAGTLVPAEERDPNRILRKVPLIGIGNPGGYMWD